MPLQDPGQIASSTLLWQCSAYEVGTLEQVGLTGLIDQHRKNYTLKMWMIMCITESYNFYFNLI